MLAEGREESLCSSSQSLRHFFSGGKIRVRDVIPPGHGGGPPINFNLHKLIGAARVFQLPLIVEEATLDG